MVDWVYWSREMKDGFVGDLNAHLLGSIRQNRGSHEIGFVVRVRNPEGSAGGRTAPVPLAC